MPFPRLTSTCNSIPVGVVLCSIVAPFDDEPKQYPIIDYITLALFPSHHVVPINDHQPLNVFTNARSTSLGNANLRSIMSTLYMNQIMRANDSHG